MNAPLHGIRVAECASASCSLPLRLAMSFAARLAAGLGAAVDKTGPAGDDPVRAVAPLVQGRSALSAFLDAGKTFGTQRDPDTAPDLVLCDEAALAALDADTARSVRVVFSTFPHGTAGAPAHASEFTVMASSGLLDLVGDPERAPLRMGGRQLAYSCGLAAYAGAVAALSTRQRTGVAEVVRVSLADVAVWLNWKSVAMASWSSAGRARMGRDAEWQVVRCADGWVALVFLEADWPVLREFVNDPRLSDARFDDRGVRRREARLVAEIVEAAFLRHTRHALRELALARRLPLGPVWTPIELETDAQNVARGFMRRSGGSAGDERLLMPRLPVLWDGQAFA